jgi:hypothetical protein
MDKNQFNLRDPEFSDLPWNEELKEELYQLTFREWKQDDAAKQLESNPAYRELREDYFESERDDKLFKEHYGRELAHALSWGPRTINYTHRNKNPFLYYAEDALCEIQQKKLFDLQCQWRAELVDIPGIYTTCDFEYWEENIREADFLSSISEGELKIYMDYLESSEYRVNWKCHTWQDYGAIKNDYNHNSGRSLIPPWYHYHNYATQNSSLLQLPDIIGEKEKIYLQKYEEYRTDTLKKNPSADIPDNRPRLSTNYETVENFLLQFKFSTGLYEYVKGIRDETQGSIAWRYYEDATEYLIDEPEPLPIEENEDWKEAFLDVVYKYRNGRVAKLLPDIYADYLQNKLDKTLPNRKTFIYKKEQQVRKNIAADYKKMIDIGRQLTEG